MSKQSPIKLTDRDHRDLKVYTWIVTIFAKIAKVLLVIGVIACGALAIVLPSQFDKVKLNNQTITFNNKEILSYERSSDRISIIVEKQTVDITDADSVKSANAFIDYLESGKLKNIGYALEVSLIFGIFFLVLAFRGVHHLDRLFKSIREDDTPFTAENVEHVHTFAKTLLIALIGSVILDCVVTVILGVSTVSLACNSLLSTSVAYVVYYLFVHAYNLQLESKKVLNA